MLFEDTIEQVSDPAPKPDYEPPTTSEFLALSAGIGSGVGASLWFAEGSVAGAALITASSAGWLGVGAAGMAGWKLGGAIGDTDLVRDALRGLMEAVFPIDSPVNPGTIEVQKPAADGEPFSVLFGAERFDVSFYAAPLIDEGWSFESDYQGGDVPYYFDPFEAQQAYVGLVGGRDYGNPYDENYTCNTHLVFA